MLKIVNNIHNLFYKSKQQISRITSNIVFREYVFILFREKKIFLLIPLKRYSFFLLNIILVTGFFWRNEFLVNFSYPEKLLRYYENLKIPLICFLFVDFWRFRYSLKDFFNKNPKVSYFDEISRAVSLGKIGNTLIQLLLNS